jgi:hypothetical protein
MNDLVLFMDRAPLQAGQNPCVRVRQQTGNSHTPSGHHTARPRLAHSQATTLPGHAQHTLRPPHCQAT